LRPVQGSFEAPPIVVRASPARGALALGGAALLDTAVAAAVVMGARLDATLVLCLGFFGLCAAAGVWMLMAPAKLVIGPDGLTERVLGASKLYRWSEVYDFRPAMIGLASRTVGFSFTPERTKRGWLARLNHALSGVDEQLNAGWEIAPAELAELLNAARERYLAAGAQPAPLPEGYAGARLNRATFAAFFVWLVAGVGALTLIPGVGDAAWILVPLFGARLFAVRLHDFGRAGWWQLLLCAAQTAAIAAALAWRSDATAAFELAAILQLGAAAALCCPPGDPGPNRYGSAPGQASPLVMAEAFR
jgi:uncharacterized membrane protein YhaH (DUF805 family)